MSKTPKSIRRRGITAALTAVFLTVTGLLGVGAAAASAQAPGFALAVNFATEANVPPAGQVSDFGKAFRARSNGNTYGWVKAGTHTPLSLVGNGRDRSSDPTAAGQPYTSFLHMQLPKLAKGVHTAGDWELAVVNGTYSVTVVLGDPGAYYDSDHWLSIEDQNAVAEFVPTATNRLATVTRVVTVTDGRLTLSASGGTNTKIDHVTVASVDDAASHPSVVTSTPANLATGVTVDESVVEDLHLPGGAVDPATLTATSVTLHRVSDGSLVAAHEVTSGGGDTVNLSPTAPLAPSTLYRFDVTAAVTDLSGQAFEPYSVVFTTGVTPAGSGIAFAKTVNVASGDEFTSITKGPDGMLYAGSLDGYIYRWTINADGTLSGQTVITTVRDHATAVGSFGAPNRTVIGLTFDPASTPTAPVLWITDNPEYQGVSNLPDFSDSLARLTGPNLNTYTEVLSHLPRSVKDHETNSIAFGPDGALYFTQGANNAMGAPDATWGNRSEHLLNAAVLRLDPSKLPATLPLDVTTVDAGGTYNPYAPGAPLTIYADGIRNAFDLVWHSNGHLYTPTNGSAAGGNTPATPAVLPAACQQRSDAATNGPYTGPAVPGLTNNPTAETDYVFDVKAGRYYGHPNPARCEWVLAGGNPTSAVDHFETGAYPVGTQPDRNLDLADIYDAGLHASADGAIEYKGAAFNGALNGKLMVVRYSSGQDIETFAVAADGPLSNRTTGITGLTGFSQPLDLTEDTATGNLYVTELGTASITLLKPVQAAPSAHLVATAEVGSPYPDRLVFNRIQNPNTSKPTVQAVHDTSTLTIANTGPSTLTVTSLPISGPWTVASAPTLPFTVASGASAVVTVRFTATSGRVTTGALTVNSSDPSNPATVIQLSGYWQSFSEGGHEPTLQDIAAVMGFDTAIPADLNHHGHVQLDGDEVLAAHWHPADPAKPVQVEQLAGFHTFPNSATLSWYDKATGTKHSLLSMNGAYAQSLLPRLAGSSTLLAQASFSTTASFGLSVDGENSDWTKNSQTRDNANGCVVTTPVTCGFHVRTWPVRDRTGALVPGSYIVTMDYSGINDDYNDNVYLVTNVVPESS